MPKHDPEHRKSPPAVGTDSENDVVDAEFTEIDEDRFAPNNFEANAGPDFPRRQIGSRERPPSRLRMLLLTVALLLIGGVAYRAVVRTDVTQKTEERSLPAGWLDLSSCAFTKSFDGKKWLMLGDDQSAQLREALAPEPDKAINERVSTGKWSYDEVSKQYSVTLDGETTKYALVSQDGVATCILVKGDLRNANLRESWFATIDDDPGDDFAD